jgi:hypothetical protein
MVRHELRVLTMDRSLPEDLCVEIPWNRPLCVFDVRAALLAHLLHHVGQAQHHEEREIARKTVARLCFFMEGNEEELAEGELLADRVQKRPVLDSGILRDSFRGGSSSPRELARVHLDDMPRRRLWLRRLYTANSVHVDRLRRTVGRMNRGARLVARYSVSGARIFSGTLRRCWRCCSLTSCRRRADAPREGTDLEQGAHDDGADTRLVLYALPTMG